MHLQLMEMPTSLLGFARASWLIVFAPDPTLEVSTRSSEKRETLTEPGIINNCRRRVRTVLTLPTF